MRYVFLLFGTTFYVFLCVVVDVVVVVVVGVAAGMLIIRTLKRSYSKF
jgi:uncharacterized membrane-anchored protein YhcB (DUF1043 family)